MPQPPTTREPLRQYLSQGGFGTVRELAVYINRKPCSVRSCIVDWRKREACPIYITSWQETSKAGKYAPVYAWGPGRRDAPPPKHKKLTKAEAGHRYYLRHKALILAKHRARRGSAAQEAHNPFTQLLHVANAVHSATKRRE